jgi:DNA-directed RNA polymerase specialized sigma24 family protein
MRIEGELSFKEIASELGVPLGTALTWMRTATLKLKEMLGESK